MSCGVPVFTSLYPKGVSEQVAAMESWSEVGCRVVTVNHPTEVEALTGRLPNWIDVLPVYFRPLHGKFLIPLKKLFATMAEYGGGRAILVNSDISLSSPTRFQKVLTRRESVVFASRMEIGPRGPVDLYPSGFDFFILRKDFLSTFPDVPFRIGVPWWDYFVPAFAISEGFSAYREPDLTFISHPQHPTNWSFFLLEQYARYFLFHTKHSQLGIHESKAAADLLSGERDQTLASMRLASVAFRSLVDFQYHSSDGAETEGRDTAQ